MKLKDWFALAVSIAICEGAGLIGSVYTMPAIAGWYQGLQTSFLNPPGWVFAPVWTLLYALMGIAAFLVWRQGWEKREVRRGLAIFLLQLVLNIYWSYLFFGLFSPALALGDIVFLWLAILWTIRAFEKVSRRAAYLLVPYILWVSFAAYLNLAVVLLN